jgi:heat-inducible transcriptional repressor
MGSKLSQPRSSAATRDAGLPDDRARRLLRALIERYIREGQPVGSLTLTRDSELDVSPATVRNIMADLEALGFVTSPHTSAGRVPTVKGYRFFVDTLIKLTPPKSEERRRFEQQLGEAASDPQAVAVSASQLLSAVTRMAGVVTVPHRARMPLRQIEFLPLSGRRVLAILVVNDREVQNKIFAVERDFTESELRQAGNYLTEQLSGIDLYQVRHRVLDELRRTRESLNALMVEAIELAQKAFPEASPQTQYVMAGETNLMGLDELTDVERLKELFEAFGHQRDILHLLDRSLDSEGVKIFIGQESGYELLDACSIVAAPYRTADGTMGVLGVIGPTRMHYERVIPIVDLTAKLLGSTLKSQG